MSGTVAIRRALRSVRTTFNSRTCLAFRFSAPEAPCSARPNHRKTTCSKTAPSLIFDALESEAGHDVIGRVAEATAWASRPQRAQPTRLSPRIAAPRARAPAHHVCCAARRAGIVGRRRHAGWRPQGLPARRPPDESNAETKSPQSGTESDGCAAAPRTAMAWTREQRAGGRRTTGPGGQCGPRGAGGTSCGPRSSVCGCRRPRGTLRAVGSSAWRPCRTWAHAGRD